MKISDFKMDAHGAYRHRSAIREFILVLATVLVLNSSPIAGAALDENISSETGTNGRLLKWSADKVYWDPAESLVVLNGNVKIIQGETMIVADNAKIFSLKNVGAEQTLKPDSVEKFVVNGNVRIVIETGVATSDMAVYFTETKKLRLSGTPAKFVMKGDNTITGSTITVDRETGGVSIEDAEAVIFSEGDL